MSKLLLIRMDRLGDLVCTLPVDQHPRIVDGSHSVQWLVTRGLEPVLSCSVPKRNGWFCELSFSWRQFWSLTRDLKSEGFDKVVLFYAPWWVAFACLMAGIRERFSPQSRWFQILFFNHTLRQNRSQSYKHEADYNWELLHWSLTGELNSQSKMPFLELKSLSCPAIELPASYVVIHPGMGGSALNWPTTHYLELARHLLSRGRSVVITGTLGDQPWLKDIEAPLKAMNGVFWFVGRLNIPELIYVLSRAEATVAPSTGVLHLSSSTGVKTLGLYSPIRVQTPTRWGPRGPRAKAVFPEVSCPATRHCFGEACQEYPCLSQVTPEQVLSELLDS